VRADGRGKGFGRKLIEVLFPRAVAVEVCTPCIGHIDSGCYGLFGCTRIRVQDGGDVPRSGAVGSVGGGAAGVVTHQPTLAVLTVVWTLLDTRPGNGLLCALLAGGPWWAGALAPTPVASGTNQIDWYPPIPRPLGGLNLGPCLQFRPNQVNTGWILRLSVLDS